MITKVCAVSGKEFVITDEDLAFYEKIGVPPPTLCPEERYRRRAAHRNEWYMYKRPCDKTGEMMVSIYAPDAPWPVYGREAWWSDDHDPLAYGREYDFGRPFFEQYLELKREVPRLGITNSESENSEYTNQAQGNKNCYLVVATSFNEDCMYGMWYQNHCKSCMDCYMIESSELMYQSLNCVRCYNGQYLENCQNCTDCIMCANCVGCKNCIGCANQQHQKYMIFNQQYSQEEWEAAREKMLSEPEEWTRMWDEYEKWLQGVPRKYYVGFGNENFSGDYIQNSKSTYEAFHARRCEDCKYLQDAWEGRDCMDMTETLDNELCYEIHGAGWGPRMIGSSLIFTGGDLDYCDLCFSSYNCLGCIGLKSNKYCILNKQYTKEEYGEMRARIIEHMKSTGEWGEFFPIGTSSYPYNTTTAQEYFPLTKEEVLERGWRWEDEDQKEYQPSSFEPPAKIDEVEDSITGEILACAETGKNYQIMPLELKLLRQMRMPIPRLHPLVRNAHRLARRNPRRLQKRVCDKEGCEVEFETTFGADGPAIVYCEECYQEMMG